MSDKNDLSQLNRLDGTADSWRAMAAVGGGQRLGMTVLFLQSEIASAQQLSVIASQSFRF